MIDSGLLPYTNGTRLMQRWQLMPGELLELCVDQIQSYERILEYEIPSEQNGRHAEGSYGYEPWAPYRDEHIEDTWFKVEDVIQFERNHPEIISQTLTKKEAQELGHLRQYKGKAGQAIAAAGAVTYWQMEQPYKLTQKALDDFMQEKFSEFAGKTWNKIIWDALPDAIKNSGKGNPREPMP